MVLDSNPQHFHLESSEWTTIITEHLNLIQKNNPGSCLIELLTAEEVNLLNETE